MRKMFASKDISVPVDWEPSSDKELSSVTSKLTLSGSCFPPSIKSQYVRIYAAILQTDLVSKGVASIIAFYSLSFGWNTNFRHGHFTYSCYNCGYPTAVMYNGEPPAFPNALLDFSFCGSCMIRFKIRKKGDEMWLGVVGDLNALDESTLGYSRGWRGQWTYYLGRTRTNYRLDNGSYPSRDEYLSKYFKPVLNCDGVPDGGIGSFQFPGKILHRLVPCNTGDIVDMAVDAQEKTFTVIVNGVFQARSKLPNLPDQLAFFVQLDYTNDCVEFEILDFNLAKTRKLKGIRIVKVANFVV